MYAVCRTNKVGWVETSRSNKKKVNFWLPFHKCGSFFYIIWMKSGSCPFFSPKVVIPCYIHETKVFVVWKLKWSSEVIVSCHNVTNSWPSIGGRSLCPYPLLQLSQAKRATPRRSRVPAATPTAPFLSGGRPGAGEGGEPASRRADVYRLDSERFLIMRCRSLEGVNRRFFKIWRLSPAGTAWTGQTGLPDRSDRSMQADSPVSRNKSPLELEPIRNLGYLSCRVFLTI